jgi:hypothetical protein
VIPRYQLPVGGLRKVKLQDFFAPILNERGAKCVLVHVGADLVTPAGSKLLELVISLIRVAISIALKIG